MQMRQKSCALGGGTVTKSEQRKEVTM
jgi:hypothetical protein